MNAGGTGSLNDLEIGGEARLVRIGGPHSFRRRLMELGLLPGTPVRVVRRAELGGVLEIEVRRCRVTVRQAEASQVVVAQE